jgi:hypothetical protein
MPKGWGPVQALGAQSHRECAGLCIAGMAGLRGLPSRDCTWLWMAGLAGPEGHGPSRVEIMRACVLLASHA